MEAPTIADLIARALAVYGGLAEVAEAVEDEWPYVTDLRAAWSARLQAVASARPTEPATPAVVAAVDGLAAEVARISDPHRAIDWLSTFPQVVLLGLEEAT